MLACALLVGAACKPALPQAPPPAGRFFLHEPVFGREIAPQQLVIDAAGWVHVAGICGEARGDFRKSGERILVRVAWESCEGFEGRLVRFSGELVAVDLGTIVGDILFPQSPVPVPVNGSKTYGSSLRMLTYNVQALPSTFHVGTVEWVHQEIANEILKAGYDVVALNEVFDEDIRAVYVSRLSGEFPYYVSKLSGDDTIVNEDSGLMLFSRWPLESLPSEKYVTGHWSPQPPNNPIYPGFPVECEGNVCSKTAALEFEACAGDDCYAEKGAGLVRVRNPETNQVTNVVFTHLQASYVPLTQPDAEEAFAVRYQQLQALREMIEETLNDGADGLRHFDREPVFVMGDLNLDGDLADHDLGPNHLDTQNRFEWEVEFNSAFGFYGDEIRDGWAVANAPKIPSGNYDRGITRIAQWDEHDGARYDYVLWNPRSRVCLQHMTLSHNLRLGAGYQESGFGPDGIGDGGWMDLSDHYGVNVDVNAVSNHCSPATAEVENPAPGTFLPLNGTLNRAGQIHWYRFDSAGTYSFDMESAAGADFRVYAADDLTTPVPQFKQETTDFSAPMAGGWLEFHGQQFRISEPPFYVRVWIPDRAATGDYQLIALKHDCATKETACALAPGERLPHELAATPPVGQPDEAWFELYTEEIPDGRSQQLTFAVGQIDPQAASDGVFHLDVYRDDNGQEVLIGTGESRPDHWDDDPWPDDLRSLVYEDQQSDRVKYWLRVRRQPPYAAPYPPEATFFDVRWQTDLKILYGSAWGGANSLQLFCSEQNDPFFDDGADEIYIDWMEADGAQVLGQTWVGDYDDGMQKSLETIVPQPLYFFDYAELRLLEYDDGLNGGDDTGVGSVGSDWVIGPLESGPLAAKSVIHLEDGGKYLFFYNLRRGFDF
ncbi:MAG: hypothetical protein DCC71_22540 [Proteobacteria bacterium]|nr:MAG: hypothetical protein DCC71_22540 [Pseudomonadota bacterium]